MFEKIVEEPVSDEKIIIIAEFYLNCKHAFYSVETFNLFELNLVTKELRKNLKSMSMVYKCNPSFIGILPTLEYCVKTLETKLSNSQTKNYVGR